MAWLLKKLRRIHNKWDNNTCKIWKENKVKQIQKKIKFKELDKCQNSICCEEELFLNFKVLSFFLN